jgi:hypothetical protein
MGLQTLQPLQTYRELAKEIRSLLAEIYCLHVGLIGVDEFVLELVHYSVEVQRPTRPDLQELRYWRLMTTIY